MNNNIKIPWYRKNVKKVKDLSFQPMVNFEFPDGKKKQSRKPNRPEPQLQPEPQPYPVKQFDNMYLRELIETPVPIPIGIPTLNDKKSNSPVPERTSDIPTWKDKIPTRSPTPRQGLSPAIKMPAGEILFKLMEAEPSGKYNNFLQTYNDISLELTWNIANPFIIFSEPSYAQVEEFLKTHDYEKITKDDVLKYFKNEGVSGKNLTTLPARIYTFKTTIDTLNALEHIIIPPIPNNEPKQY